MKTVPTVTAACLLAAAAAGCAVTTTQQKDDWLTVKAERTLVKSDKVKVAAPDPDVEVTDATIVRGDKETAFSVALENTGDQPVNDLPIAVGVKGGGDEPLNLTKGASYFEAHIGALAAGESGTWVFVTKDDVPEGEPFAKVGEQADPPLTVAETLPAVDVSQTGTADGKDGGTVDLQVSNSSGVPQYDLEIFATATKGGKVVAAGTATLDDLENGDSHPVKLALVGDPKGAQVDVFAPPTIFK